MSTKSDHPITPMPELVQQWATASPVQSNDENWAYEMFIAHRAAQWGADQELEAVLELCDEWLTADTLRHIRATRRPKPQTLKQQALEAVKQFPVEPNSGPWRAAMETIIRALEALDE